MTPSPLLPLCALALALAFGIGLEAAAQTQDGKPKDSPPAAAPAAPPVPRAAVPSPAPSPADKDGAQKPPNPADDEPPPAGLMVDQPQAVLQALDKITARVRRLTVNVGRTVPFGTLTIEVDSCRKAPPEDPPESAAFLKIVDAKPGEAPQTAFTGWMFASSPALSALDHPVYDIWVVDCSSDPTASPAPAH